MFNVFIQFRQFTLRIYPADFADLSPSTGSPATSRAGVLIIEFKERLTVQKTIRGRQNNLDRSIKVVKLQIFGQAMMNCILLFARNKINFEFHSGLCQVCSTKIFWVWCFNVFRGCGNFRFGEPYSEFASTTISGLGQTFK